LQLALVSDRYQSNGNCPPPFLKINNQHDFKGWVENQRIVLCDKTLLLTLTSVEKWFGCLNGPTGADAIATHPLDDTFIGLPQTQGT